MPSVLALCLKDTAGFYQRMGFAETPMNLVPKQMQVASPPPPPLPLLAPLCLVPTGPPAKTRCWGTRPFLCVREGGKLI